MSEPASGSESTRDLAHQRRPDQSHFQTPSWIGPDRRSRTSLPPSSTSSVPQQASPTHDDEVPPAGARQPAAVADTGHWVGSTTGRTAMSLLLIASLIVTIGAGALMLREQTADSAILVSICAVVSAGIWALMAVTRPMVVDLNGQMLTVKHHGSTDVFNLADPFQSVEIRGALGSPSWALALGRDDGSTVVVGSKAVPPAELHHVVTYHRQKAAQRRTQRETNFGR